LAPELAVANVANRQANGFNEVAPSLAPELVKFNYHHHH